MCDLEGGEIREVAKVSRLEWMVTAAMRRIAVVFRLERVD